MRRRHTAAISGLQAPRCRAGCTCPLRKPLTNCLPPGATHEHPDRQVEHAEQEAPLQKSRCRELVLFNVTAMAFRRLS